MADESVTPAAAPVAPAAVVAPVPPEPKIGAPAPAAVEPQPEVVVEEPKPEPQAPSGQPYELVANVPDKEMSEERSAYLTEFSTLAPALGLDPSTSQAMVDAVIEAAVTMPGYSFDQHVDHLDAEREIVNQVGAEGAKHLIARAQRQATAMGEDFKTWLDETNLGNDVSVIRVLALAETGLFKVSPGKAQEMLGKITGDPKGAYYSSDPKLRLPEVVRVQILSRIAARNDVNPSTQAVQEHRMRATAPASSPDAVASARAELTKLASQKSMSEADRARWIELTATIAR